MNQLKLPDCILLNDNYIDQASSLIAGAFPFHSKHSWARALELPDNNLKPYLTNYLKDNIHRSYAISMNDNNNDNNNNNNNGSSSFVDSSTSTDISLPILSGVVIAEVQTIDSTMGDIKKQQDDEEYTAYGAIEGILNECTIIFIRELSNRGYNSDSNLKYGYISWIATKDSDRKKGIASSLINTCSNALKHTENCSLIAAYCVSPSATKVFLNQGFNIWGQVPYHSYKYKGRIPYQILPDEISIVVKDLTLS